MFPAEGELTLQNTHRLLTQRKILDKIRVFHFL